VAVILSDQTQTFWVWSISATGAVVVLFGSKRFVFPALMVLALLDVVTLVIAVR
jgi:hypothetical protein